jgi:hypothetical protein
VIAMPEQPVADPPQGPREDAGGQVDRRHAADARRALVRSLRPTRRTAAVPVALLLLAGGVLTVTEIVLARLGLPPLVAPRQRLTRQIASFAFDDPAVTAGAALAALLGVLLLTMALLPGRPRPLLVESGDPYVLLTLGRRSLRRLLTQDARQADVTVTRARVSLRRRRIVVRARGQSPQPEQTRAQLQQLLEQRLADLQLIRPAHLTVHVRWKGRHR